MGEGESSGPFLYHLIAKRFYTLVDGFIVGRTSGALTFNQDGRMSRQHCKFTLKGGVAFVEDLKSTNGTVVNGNKIAPGSPVRIEDGATLEIGDQTFTYSKAKAAPALGVEGSSDSQESIELAQDAENYGDDNVATRAIERRGNRIRVPPLRDVAFTIGSASHSVTNVSKTGLALVRKEPDTIPASGTVVKGSLSMRDQKVELTVKVVRKTPILVGCEIQDHPPEYDKFLNRHFSIEMVAATLQQTDTIMQGVAVGWVPRRFAGPDGSELGYAVCAGQIMQWYAVIFGNRIEWDRPSGKFGGMGGASAAQVAGTVIRFIQGITGLDDEIRDKICEQLMEQAGK
jgi:hypothetical protein